MAVHTLHRVKRSCLHNLRVTSAVAHPEAGVPEGLVLPQELMTLADIAPFEQIVCTKISGTNWINRMYSFVVPGRDDRVETRGSLSYLLQPGEFCCIIAGTYLDGEAHSLHCADEYDVPLVDVRLDPDSKIVNDVSKSKVVLEQYGQLNSVASLPRVALEKRRVLPRVLLSNLLTGLVVEEVERRGCIEMSAELPIEYMRRAGFCRNQTIFVFNSSRGAISAESYVVPSETKNTVGISGALAACADEGDMISEAAFVVTTEQRSPVLFNAHMNRANTAVVK